MHAVQEEGRSKKLEGKTGSVFVLRYLRNTLRLLQVIFVLGTQYHQANWYHNVAIIHDQLRMQQLNK